MQIRRGRTTTLLVTAWTLGVLSVMDAGQRDSAVDWIAIRKRLSERDALHKSQQAKAQVLWSPVPHVCNKSGIMFRQCVQRLGALKWKSGWNLQTSSSALVGGLSDLLMEDYANRLVAISDGGWIAEFSIPHPNASSEIVLHSLPDDEGGFFGSWWGGNPEAFTVGPNRSFGLIALEGKAPRVLRYTPRASDEGAAWTSVFTSPASQPAAVRGIGEIVKTHCTGANFGIEAMALMEDGEHLVVVCESPAMPKGSYDGGWAAASPRTPVFLLRLRSMTSESPHADRLTAAGEGPHAELVDSFHFPLVDGLMPSALARLPPGVLPEGNGGFIVLERIYMGDRGCLIRLHFLHEQPFVEALQAAQMMQAMHSTQPLQGAQPTRAVPSSTLLAPRLIAELCPDESLTDNFEGLALKFDATRGPGGSVSVVLLTDDNFARGGARKHPQATLLFEFELDPSVLAAMIRERPRKTPSVPRCASTISHAQSKRAR